jgi:hypothetical protein
MNTLQLLLEGQRRNDLAVMPRWAARSGATGTRSAPISRTPLAPQRCPRPGPWPI